MMAREDLAMCNGDEEEHKSGNNERTDWVH